ncbi:DUF3243 domain-containing protein [Sporolactobacillus sp. Y61]|uniref:DUF3243 domain-containing protein n=1 Tax=Sporolactobacillus sp. Y61 TaxID=3160863 RepID=A0AAU8ICS4_9BACL
MSVLENWDKWKTFLGEKADQAQKMGVDEETLTGFAKKIGDYLSQNVDPKTDQERVLSDLWHVAEDHEREMLAHLMLKLVDQDAHRMQRQS